MSNRSKYGVPAILGGVVICLGIICCSVALLWFFGDTILSGTGISLPISPPISGPIVPADTSNLPEWTIIVYSDADDDVLEEDLLADVNEMELVGSNPQMNIVVQIDRAEGAFGGDGDWTDTRRLLITQDADLNQVTSQVVENIGEADMGDPQTLADFVTWSIQHYPAKKYALIMSDHGGGWTGGFSDLQSDSSLTLREISGAVAQVQGAMGGQKFEIIGFDACLMAMIEVYGSLYPYSNYMVASEEVIPATGWSYASWLGKLAQDPTADGRTVTQAIVSSYVVEDSVLAQRATAAEIQEIESGTTLSAIDSARVPDVITAMNQFISTIAAVDQTWVAQGREYARGYYSIFGEDVPSSFIDLGNFAEIMATTNDPAIQQANEQLRTAIASAVIAEKHGQRMAGSTGISFHFPISDIYVLTEFTDRTPVRYATDAAQFLEQSSWDEFLAYHYTGQAFVPQQGQAFVPNRSAQVVAPGASELSIAPIQLSNTVITGDETLTLSTTITGNVSYIYFVLYFYNTEANVTWVADTSFVIAPDVTTVGGASAPDYGPSPIQVSYDWTPVLYELKDGQHDAYALFEPDEYQNAAGITTYSVYGQYTQLNDVAPVDAKLVFDPDGNLLNIYALPDTNNDGITTPVAITPQFGDHFTDYVHYYTVDDQGNSTFHYELSEDVFTYGEQGFWFESYTPVDGQYAIGFYAVDFDNNATEQYEYITYQYQK